jgi:hypothetical protein
LERSERPYSPKAFWVRFWPTKRNNEREVPKRAATAYAFKMLPYDSDLYACAHDEIKGIAGCVEDGVTYTHWRCINNTDIIPDRGYISNTDINTLPTI